MSTEDTPKKPADETLPSRSRLISSTETKPPIPDSSPAADSEIGAVTAPGGESIVSSTPPWTLQQFFNGEIDLDVELVKRFPNMPLMSLVKFRSLGSKTRRGVATLSTPDGASSVIFDADATTRIVQMSFTYGSMLTLRFTLDQLGDLDRTRWLELMRREQGGLAFLWGPSRWERDYVICVARKYFTNFYAFSPHNFDAAVRMTPDVTKNLLDWLENFWKQSPPADEEPPKLLTW